MASLDVAKKNELSLARPKAALAVFGATLFASALLMFLIQPMFAKMALPRLGGTAAVWSLALVFFQGVLLLGYLYAHLLVKTLSLRNGVVIHALVMGTAVVSLPITISAGWDTPPDEGQAMWLLGLFAASVGLPFFAIAANAPLLQSWFSRSGHAQSDDPYFLYGASNAGSFAALIAYPLLVEPFLGLVPQTQAWSVGYLLLVALVGLCGVLAAMAARTDAGAHAAAPLAETAATWRERLVWVVLSFVPSGLLVGCTAHLATDLISAPFMWVVPLAIYLLTFVITFQTKPWISHRFVIERLGVIVAPMCLFTLSPTTQLWLVPVHLLAVFMLMMACHGELVRLRPAAGRLTEFYLLMSLGGVLGGMFASLAAPSMFDSIVEYPLLMIAGFAAIGLIRGRKSFTMRFFMAAALIPLVASVMLISHDTVGGAKQLFMIGWMLLSLGLLLVSSREPLAQAAILVTVMLVYHSVSKIPAPIVQSRSFYGVLSVYPAIDGRYHLLAHGTTKHGSQMMKDANGLRLTDNPEPQSYYYAGGPFGSLIRHLREGGNALEGVAVVGLGTGAMLCHALPGEGWTFYEIDPEVMRIAADPQYFTYLRDCGPSTVVIGDGRLKLREEKAEAFDLIVLDAFSSDSVPAHLLTAEALDMYMTKLKPDGAIVFHISNRFMELASVIEGAARDRGLAAYYNTLDLKYWNPDPAKLDQRPYLAVVARSPEALRGLPQDPAWHTATADEVAPAWTDDYSNVIGAIWRKFTGHTPFDR